MRTVGVVTVARSDYGIYRSVLDAIRAHPSLELELYVTGMHLSGAHGRTVELIEKDGMPICERVPALLADDSPAGIGRSMGLTTLEFASVFERRAPDIVLVLGDRFEMHAAALAAVPHNIPIAHIHGGELSEGAMDDAFRHSLSKMSHLHFVSTESHGKRLQQMGEEAWRIDVCGAPALDLVSRMELPSLADVEKRFGLDLSERPVLVTFHPATRRLETLEVSIAALLGALEPLDLPIVFTAPNADTHGALIRQAIERFVNARPRASLVENLGIPAYFRLMTHARAMVGNSSSGLIEAPSFELPVVNIGIRQRGRTRARNVIDCGEDVDSIARALEKALSGDFRESLSGLINPYGQGQAAARIVRRLAEVPLDDTLLVKTFQDVTLT